VYGRTVSHVVRLWQAEIFFPFLSTDLQLGVRARIYFQLKKPSESSCEPEAVTCSMAAASCDPGTRKGPWGGGRMRTRILICINAPLRITWKSLHSPPYGPGLPRDE